MPSENEIKSLLYYKSVKLDELLRFSEKKNIRTITVAVTEEVSSSAYFDVCDVVVYDTMA